VIYRNHGLFEADAKEVIVMGGALVLIAVLLIWGWKYALLTCGIFLMLAGIERLAAEYAKHICYSLLRRFDLWAKKQ
jgi:hypothetical protein